MCCFEPISLWFRYATKNDRETLTVYLFCNLIKNPSSLVIIFNTLGNVFKWMTYLCLYSFLLSPLDCKEIKADNPKGNQPWKCIGRTETEAAILWPPDVKSWLIRKDPDSGKDWRKEEKWATEDEMVGCHHWLSGHEFEQTLGVVKDREAWHAAVHGVTESQTLLSEQQLDFCQLKITAVSIPCTLVFPESFSQKFYKDKSICSKHK